MFNEDIGAGQADLTNATKRSNDFRRPERPRVSMGDAAMRVGVRGRTYLIALGATIHRCALPYVSQPGNLHRPGGNRCVVEIVGPRPYRTNGPALPQLTAAC